MARLMIDPVHDLPETAWILFAKAIGAVAGSAISIAYILPKGRREAALRFLTGMVIGLIFGTSVGLKLATELDLVEHLSIFEISLTGAALASLFAWWGLGILARLGERYNLTR